MASARADDRRDGTGREAPPLRGFVLTCRRRRRWSRTKPYGDRRRPVRGRVRCTRRTSLHGARAHLTRGSGPVSRRSPGRRGATAPCGAPQRTTCRPSPCPALAGSTGEVVDSSSLRFLTASALKARREEEEEEERKKKEKEKMEERSAVHVEAAVALERARLLLEQASKRRKRKKRRKRRTPRTSSLPSLRRTRRRPRRWHAPGCSSVFLLALCSSLSLAGPRCLASRPFWTRRTVTRFFFTMACARLVLLVLYTSRCVFSQVCRPMMLGIKAGMDQTDILALVDTGICMVKVQLLDEVVVPVVCNDICLGPAACTVGDDFRIVSVFCVALGSTADTCGASVYKAFWKNFSHLSLKRWIAVLEVDSRLSVLPVFSAMLGSTVGGGESFSPDDAYDSAWNSVKPMKGKYTINYFQYQDVVGCVCMHNDASAASTFFLRPQPQLLPVQVEGQASQCRRCCHTTVVTPCSSSADCPAGVFASRCRVVV